MPATQVAPDARTILPALGRAASISPPLSPGLERASLPRTLTSSWGRPYLATGHAGHTDMAPPPRVWQLCEDHCSSRAPHAVAGGLCGDCIAAQLLPCPGPPPPLSFHSSRTSCTLVCLSLFPREPDPQQLLKDVPEGSYPMRSRL